MIPLSLKESIEFKDPSDGMLFKFKPKGGILEREQLNIWKDADDADLFRSRLDEFIDKIIIVPVYDMKASDVLNIDEKLKIIGFWNEANKLTKEEKKN